MTVELLLRLGRSLVQQVASLAQQVSVLAISGAAKALTKVNVVSNIDLLFLQLLFKRLDPAIKLQLIGLKSEGRRASRTIRRSRGGSSRPRKPFGVDESAKAFEEIMRSLAKRKKGNPRGGS
jgi:hypothetical protein